MNRLFHFALAALSVTALPLAGAKETPPAGSAPKPFKLPPTEDFTLPNGMRVTMAPFGAIPKVAIRAYIDAGAVRDPASKIWLSKLTAALMKEGTASRSAAQLANEAADMGGQLDIDSRREAFIAGGVVLSDFGSQFTALLADVLLHPSLPAGELPRLKADLARQLAVAKTEPGSLAREKFYQTMFPGQPYGRVFPADGAVEKYELADVKTFADANVAASRTHLYVVGKYDASLRPAIESAFASWKRGTSEPLPEAKPVAQYSLNQIDRPGAAQSTVYVGLPVASPRSADYVPLAVMDSILGGSFGSRITANIREQKGYTYSPFSQVAEAGHQSYWVEIADVTTAVTGPSIHEIFSEIGKLRKDPPPEAEVKAIKNYLSGLFVLKNTISPDAVINQLHFVDAQDLNRSFLANYVGKVEAVTPTEIQRITETYINPGKMTVVVVGDKAKTADQLKEFESAPH